MRIVLLTRLEMWVADDGTQSLAYVQFQIHRRQETILSRDHPKLGVCRQLWKVHTQRLRRQRLSCGQVAAIGVCLSHSCSTTHFRLWSAVA